MLGKPLCNNCENYGHLFYNCKRPITSLGIICYRYNGECIEYLMVQRKDSLGYVDFLRGKYNEYNNFHIKNIIQEMTNEEIYQIIDKTYEELWDKLWNKQDEPYDMKNKEKMNFIKLNKKHLLKINGWIKPEWGFPKGRRNYREKDIDCAFREFREETGYDTTNLNILQNVQPVEEVFTGSNLKSYKHKYYVCKIQYKYTLNEDNYQRNEIGNMKWGSLEECLYMIRYYNIEKKEILNYVNDLIKNNRIY